MCPNFNRVSDSPVAGEKHGIQVSFVDFMDFNALPMCPFESKCTAIRIVRNYANVLLLASVESLVRYS